MPSHKFEPWLLVAGCDSTVIKNDRGGDGEMNDESSLFIPSSVLDVPQNYLVKFSSKEPVKIGNQVLYRYIYTV